MGGWKVMTLTEEQESLNKQLTSDFTDSFSESIPGIFKAW